MLFSLVVSVLFNLSNPALYNNYQDALAMAKKENKHILMIFSGSDWCRPCIKLKKSILDQQKFQDWANDNLILMHVDFPAKKRNRLPESLATQNDHLASKFNRSGVFPQLVLIDGNENLICRIEYKDQSLEQFISDCKMHTNSGLALTD